MTTRLRLLPIAAKKITSHLMVVLLIVALLGFLALFLWQSLQIQKMQGEYQRKKDELALVQARTDGLQDHLDFYKGPGYLLYVEAVARQALGLVKPGETVVLTIPDTTTSQSAGIKADSPTANAPPSGQSHKTNWQNWLGFFLGQ